jgi:hypothetical protein
MVASREVEAHKSADLHKRQNAAVHQLVDVSDAAPEVVGDFRFVYPLNSGRNGVFLGLHGEFGVCCAQFDSIRETVLLGENWRCAEKVEV